MGYISSLNYVCADCRVKKVQKVKWAFLALSALLDPLACKESMVLWEKADSLDHLETKVKLEKKGFLAIRYKKREPARLFEQLQGEMLICTVHSDVPMGTSLYTGLERPPLPLSV